MGSKAAPPPCHVVAVPYPGRGHVNAMLNLCRLLAARDGVSATVVVTEEWLGLLGAPAALPALGPRVRFETIPNVIPSEHGRANDMVGFLEAVYTKMEEPFDRLLDRLAPLAPAAIVADVFVPWTVAVGVRRGVPVCVMCPLSATMFAVHYHFNRLLVAAGGSASPVAEIADGTDPCLIENYIPGTKSIRLSDIEPTHANTNTNKSLLKKVLEPYSNLRNAQCVMVTSFHELESGAIDSLRQELSFPVYAVGPCIPFMALQEHKASPVGEGHMAWLDAQPVGSVLYVSLGSFLSVSSAQLDEIAVGLAKSKSKFLWVLRDADARSRVRGLVHGCDAGLVVPWTDQLKVLCHPSVGGFFTHCGMNSTLEAVYAGVPMLTLPIAFDQPTNSRLVVEVWKTGLDLKEKARADGVIGREEIAADVARLMHSDAAEAEDMRRRATMLKDAARAASEEGGSSWKDITSFINFISQ
ncbi:UDP-glycosyltransferase 87A2-like [Phragmites australis]|uniref:UDP-glycosyltransferase 87A2-like n=1 Tax=Phragmites australis TaxID=29695 RepID=UPI002D776EF2|nr:UDP-glycosyltransferase 87A2-like [Phragmites australis]